MVTVPRRQSLGRPRVNGAAPPAQINPNVAYDIGRAGRAQAAAWNQIAGAFATLGAKQQAVQDQTWMAERQVAVLEAQDRIHRETSLTAGEDGTGFENAPLALKNAIEEQENVPGGSEKQRQEFKLWSIRRAYETGKWATDTAQERLRTSELGKLDKRLDSMTNLATANPDLASEYFNTYKNEVEALTGVAINPAEATERVNQARQKILKAGVVSKAKVNPEDFAKAVGALDEAGVLREDGTKRSAAGGELALASKLAVISGRLETGTTDPLKGVKQIAKDTGGSRSYGNFGINSRGGSSSSAAQFKREYGARFGLTAEPGTAAFNKQWKNAAGAAPVELHQAELEWYNANILSKVTPRLQSVGVPAAVAGDERVKAYFADRMVQYGPKLSAYGNRIRKAWAASDGDAERFLREMTTLDQKAMSSDFRSAIATGTYGRKGHLTRTRGRLASALGVGNIESPLFGSKASSEADRRGIKIKDLPKIEGSIQPEELMSLSPEDFQRVTRELRPYLTTQLQKKMENAVSSLISKGSQDVISEAEIDEYKPLIGAKTAQKWKDTLREADQMHLVKSVAMNMSPQGRQQMLRDLVPTGNPEDLAADERQRYDMWRTSIAHINKQINEDPLKFVTMENESGRQAANLIANAPTDASGLEDRERAFDTIIELQRREGVSASDVRIMGEGQAQSVVSQLTEAKSGPHALGIVNGLRQTYGRHFNQVWGELVSAGAPPSFLSLTTATAQGQNALVDTYVLERALSEGAGGKSRKDLLRERAGVSRADLGQAVANEIVEFGSALKGGTASDRLFESYRQAVERTALRYMVSEGMGLNEAVSRSAGEIYGKNLEVYRGAIIPRNTPKVDQVRNGLASGYVKLIDGIADKVDTSLILAPEQQGGAARRQYIRRLRANPEFITTEDMTGVYVRDSLGQYVHVKGDDGEMAPLIFTWEQLAEIDTGLGR